MPFLMHGMDNQNEVIVSYLVEKKPCLEVYCSIENALNNAVRNLNKDKKDEYEVVENIYSIKNTRSVKHPRRKTISCSKIEAFILDVLYKSQQDDSQQDKVFALAEFIDTQRMNKKVLEFAEKIDDSEIVEKWQEVMQRWQVVQKLREKQNEDWVEELLAAIPCDEKGNVIFENREVDHAGSSEAFFGD